MTPLTLAVIFASPALFPSLHPLAVWVGMASLGAGVWVTLRADEYGDCESALRAMEASAWLGRMKSERVA
jgi:hypothetical protein